MGKALSIPLPRRWPRVVQSALLHAIGLERVALSEVRAGFENSPDPRARLAAALDRALEEIRLVEEEMRILRARLGCLPARERPYYPPPERFAILTLRARRGWNAAQTARRFLLTPATVASWMRRLDEQGPDALVKTRVPVNRFDDAVTELVHDLHQAAPQQGRRKRATSWRVLAFTSRRARFGGCCKSRVLRFDLRLRVRPRRSRPNPSSKPSILSTRSHDAS